MSSQTDAQKDISPGVRPVAPWRVRSVSTLPGFQLAVTFQDGKSGVADLSTVTSSSRNGIYAPLADPTFFNRVALVLGVVTWPNDADLDPAWMHENIREGATWVVPF